MREKRLRWLWLLLAVCLALSGCGGQLPMELDEGEDKTPWQEAEEEQSGE